MSDVKTTARKTTAPNARKPRAKKATAEPIALEQVRILYAAQKNISTSDAGKVLRRKLRTTNVWHTLCEADPSQYGKDGKCKTDANDKRPWGTLPRTFVADVLGVEVK